MSQPVVTLSSVPGARGLLRQARGSDAVLFHPLEHLILAPTLESAAQPAWCFHIPHGARLDMLRSQMRYPLSYERKKCGCDLHLQAGPGVNGGQRASDTDVRGSPWGVIVGDGPAVISARGSGSFRFLDVERLARPELVRDADSSLPGFVVQPRSRATIGAGTAHEG